jgi:hypothetical protein
LASMRLAPAPGRDLSGKQEKSHLDKPGDDDRPADSLPPTDGLEAGDD